MSYDVSVGIVRTPDKIQVFEYRAGEDILMATFGKDDALGALVFIEQTQKENGSSYEGISLSGFSSKQEVGAGDGEEEDERGLPPPPQRRCQVGYIN